MQAIQLDVTSSAAQQLLPLLLKVETQKLSVQAKRALNSLRRWQGDMAVNSNAALIYTSWIKNFSQSMYADELKGSFKKVFDTRTLFLSQVLKSDSVWCDNIDTQSVENCQQLLVSSLEHTIAKLSQYFGHDIEKWRWGDAHHAVFSNSTFDSVPWLKNMADVSISVGGNTRTINNSQTKFNQEGSFSASKGSRYRQIIDLSNLSNSLFSTAPGVSGNLMSPFYSHLAEGWAKGDYLQLKGSLLELRAQGLSY
jgi:penicillin amidase